MTAGNAGFLKAVYIGNPLMAYQIIPQDTNAQCRSDVAPYDPAMAHVNMPDPMQSAAIFCPSGSATPISDLPIMQPEAVPAQSDIAPIDTHAAHPMPPAMFPMIASDDQYKAPLMPPPD